MKTSVSRLMLLMMLFSVSGIYAIEDPRKKDPLIITGALGTQSTLYYSSGGSSASPLNYSMYANLNVNLYGYNMPFAFYYSSNNYSFSHPQFAFNFSPTYKGWTLHLGRRSMPFSSYVYNLPFNGVGLEYKSAKTGFRFGLFYGILRDAVNFVPGEMPSGRPVYKRSGWGLKLGYGNSRNYFDLYLFRSQDHRSSIDEIWYNEVNAQENIVVGLKGRWQIFRCAWTRASRSILTPTPQCESHTEQSAISSRVTVSSATGRPLLQEYLRSTALQTMTSTSMTGSICSIVRQTGADGASVRTRVRCM